MTRQPLDKALRRALESTVTKAREVAEQAAFQAIKRLSVGDAKPADYLTEAQRRLRNRLRAHGRQLGDRKQASGEQSIQKLVAEVAYEHWHRMLFARFLEQNHLLMYDEYTPLSLAECDDFVKEADVARDELEKRCTTGWELAGVLASKMLPQIFRIDSPGFELEFSPEHQRSLEQLVTGIALETFQAQDSLGWVYQFWQSKRKEEVNKSEVKIGADELAPVTQLFTEPYMVSFLLDNSLGAWWAGQRLTASDWQNAQAEQELRDKAAIPGVPLSYLRFAKDDSTHQWQPASGTFDTWPKHLRELKTLDPCCGSGHFLVAVFLMLVPLRMEQEQLNAQQAVDAVLRDNIYGLELDQRCVELAAFALALNAWKYPDAGGYRALPEIQVACSGLAVNAAKDEWKQLAAHMGGKQNLSIAMDWLHDNFKDAPILGSLMNPAKSKAAGLVSWQELSQALDVVLAQESESTEQHETAVVAQGIAKAATLLANKYSWVITNVPYLARGKQHPVLADFCEEHYPAGKNDLATVFLDRCLEFCTAGGSTSIVLPQNWLFLTSYKKFREKLLKQEQWNLIARLGPKGFTTPMWDFNVQLISISKGSGVTHGGLFGEAKPQLIRGLDVSDASNAAAKAEGLIATEVKSVEQVKQLENPDSRVSLTESNSVNLLKKYSYHNLGICTGDSIRFYKKVWEQPYRLEGWKWMQGTVDETVDFGGMDNILFWQDGSGELYGFVEEKLGQDKVGSWLRGKSAWGKIGVLVSAMGKLPVTNYMGGFFDENTVVISIHDNSYLTSIKSYLSSEEYHTSVRAINQTLKVRGDLVKIHFDHHYWTQVAGEKYPHGLPQPYTNDPTQWIFHGHPCGSVIWDEESKWTAKGELRVDDTVLQVAVARLLGYQWPAELDPDMELAEEQRAWVDRCKVLENHVDDDGIVCLPPLRGENAADQRLEALLQDAYGEHWTTPLRNRLLESVGSQSLSAWLRDKFFEQHCKLFQNRPFIWHIWDGLKDGFSVLVNYHQFNKAGLERLIYTYLGDWIHTQQAGIASNQDGADIRLAAAEGLKKELEAILEGEKPYDIFVRWKPLSEQPIGWNPDLNDGVRLNIRPFLLAKDMGKKGAGILRFKPNVKWTKDRGTDVKSAPWYHLGLEYGGKEGDRINEHHLSLAEKRAAQNKESK